MALGLSASQAGAVASLFAIGSRFVMLHNIMQFTATKMAPSPCHVLLAVRGDVLPFTGAGSDG